MPQYRYIATPFQGVLKTGGNVQEVGKQLTDLINSYAQQGWEFVEVADITIQVQPGCLAGLFGATASFVPYNQVIFRAMLPGS